MANYRDFRTSNAKRRRAKKIKQYGIILIVAVFILGMAYFIVRIIENWNSNGDTSNPISSEISQVGSLPEEPSTDPTENTQYWTPEGPVPQTINFEIIVPDTRMIAAPRNGRVETYYFDTAVMVGDSLSQGWTVYGRMSNANVVAYRGISPQGFTGLQSEPDGTQIVPLDKITDSQPRKIYIMLGTNSLVSLSDEAFLAYYEELIQEMQRRMPGVEIYIQSVLPVTGDVAAARPALDNNRIRSVNDQLARIAYENGVYFLNVQEVFTDENGNLKAELAAADGIHLKPSGYDVWADYLITHVAHRQGNPYVPGSPYYEGGLI